MPIRQIYDKIKAIKLLEEFPQDIQSQSDRNDIQWKCIQTLINTELNYLTKIQDLLVLMHNSFEKFSFRSIISKTQLSMFYQHFPNLFDFHYSLQIKLQKELGSSQLIGKRLIEFLVNPDLFHSYIAFVKDIPSFLNLCLQIKLNEATNKYSYLCSVDSAIMMPIQRFPQLQLVVLDIYKHTQDDHPDKIDLYKAICLIKSMSMCLDMHQRLREFNEINEISNFMKRIRINIRSQRVISKHSVFYLKPDFTIPRKLIKLPYYLILCDSEIIMYPRDQPLAEVLHDMVFYFNLTEVNVQIKNLFNFTNQNKANEIQTVKELFPLIRNSFIDNKIIGEFDEIIHDYEIIGKISDDVRRLNYAYPSLDQSDISRSLLRLEKKMCEKERELNNYFDSVLNLKITKSDHFQDMKIFQFDSSRQTNEWKINFYRMKLLISLHACPDWIPIVIGNQNISEKIFPELPLSFDFFPLKENGIINIKYSVIKCQVIIIDIGVKISRCLWLSMSDGSVIILHFHYNAWSVVESFQTKFKEPVSHLCSFSFFDPTIADIPLDIEMWTSCKNQIITYSLESKLRPQKKISLKLPSTITGICQVENRIYIAQQSLDVYVYSKKILSRWIHEETIGLKPCLSNKFDELQKIVCDDNKLIYFVFHKRIAIFSVSDKEPLKVFSSEKTISSFYISLEGIWLAFVNELDLQMYDKRLNLPLQKFCIPFTFFGVQCSLESVSSMVITDKQMWIGTKNGFIMIVSTMDRLSCIDEKVTIYINSKYYENSVDILLPFQPIHGISLKTKYQIELKRNNLQSSSPHSKINGKSSDSSLSEDETDYFSNSTLKNTYENLKNSSPTIILSIGNGLWKFNQDKQNENMYPTAECLRVNEQCLFTFLE